MFHFVSVTSFRRSSVDRQSSQSLPVFVLFPFKTSVALQCRGLVVLNCFCCATATRLKLVGHDSSVPHLTPASRTTITNQIMTLTRQL